MNTQNSIGQALGLVVTKNFVEAEDIADALRRFDVGDVQHTRTTQDAIDLLEQLGRAPMIALVSFEGGDDAFAALVQSLRDVDAQTVLINGNPDLAQKYGTSFLQRPFSHNDLDRRIEALVPGV